MRAITASLLLLVAAACNPRTAPAPAAPAGWVRTTMPAAGWEAWAPGPIARPPSAGPGATVWLHKAGYGTFYRVEVETIDATSAARGGELLKERAEKAKPAETTKWTAHPLSVAGHPAFDVDWSATEPARMSAIGREILMGNRIYRLEVSNIGSDVPT